MPIRKIVKIDEELCNGCGECVPSCAEGAIQIIDGKAKLIGDVLCDGLGACLGDCPEGAISIEERDADEFDEKVVAVHLAKQGHAPADHAPAGSPRPQAGPAPHPMPHGHGAGGCPGSRMLQFDPPAGAPGPAADEAGPGQASAQPSTLRQWPVQLHLVSPAAPYFQKADVLLAADCTAFAMGDFHSKHLKGKGLAVACPKLDQGQEIYLQKLVAMIDEAEINTLTVMIMEVPCCAGLAGLAQEAAARAKRKVPVKRMVVGLRGEVIEENWI